MNDLSQESLLREIEEDIRRERFAKLWRRYGAYLMAAVVVMLASVAGHTLWQDRATARRGEAAEQLAAALVLTSENRAAAEERLRLIARDGPSGYAMLAAFQQAALLAKGDDRQAARSAYQDLQRSVGDPIYRDLAVLSEAMIALGGESLPIDADAIRDKLQPFTLDGNPWRFSARELTAVLAWRSGQTGNAKDWLAALTADPQAPSDVRERAERLLTQIGQV